MSATRACDVCGESRDSRQVTAEDRARWPGLARWIREMCSECRQRFDRAANKAAA